MPGLEDACSRHLRELVDLRRVRQTALVRAISWGHFDAPKQTGNGDHVCACEAFGVESDHKKAYHARRVESAETGSGM